MSSRDADAGPSKIRDLRPAEVATVLGDDARRVPELHTIWAGAQVAGPAYTVRSGPGDNLALHRALEAASAGELIVAEISGRQSTAVWGELMSIAAKAARIAGLVVDGAVRDAAAITRIGFPVFAAGLAPHPAKKLAPGELGVPIQLRGVPILPGDLIVADDDGVIVVPSSAVATVMTRVDALRARERLIADKLRSGESTIVALDLPR